MDLYFSFVLAFACQVSDITIITLKILRNEGVKNLSRGVGGIVRVSLNNLFLVILFGYHTSCVSSR